LALTQVPTKDVPQADVLREVVKAAEAVSLGSSTFQEIAKHIGLVERQGRYYRLASEILGLTERISANASMMTPLGDQLLHSSPNAQQDILRNQVLKVPIIQSVVGMLVGSGGTASRNYLVDSIKTLANTTKGLADRRLVTILSWLGDLGVISRHGDSIKLRSLPSSINNIEILDPEAPVLPRPNDLKLFAEVPRKLKAANEIVTFEIDTAKTDRANAVHEKLRSVIADRIRQCGTYPTSNKYIDLAARIKGQDFIIEVKSSGGDVRSQIRRGIAQLYEYRYLQGLQTAKLVLCLERPLSGANEWYLDYLIHDREISVIWDASNNDLFTTNDCKAVLPFMI
jgi:hypothetical protein